MRREFIEFNKDMPIKIELLEIENYPLHWHNALEIIYVLKGSIDIEIGTGKYSISEREIEIVNPNEAHSLKMKEENLILLININPDFFEKYYEGAKEIFYYVDSSDRKIQEGVLYQELRKYISILFYEIVAEYEDSKEIIEENLLELMYFLLNNFHYLFYEEESLRDDDFKLERYHRIVNYINTNYMNRISLQEIADQEFLTSQYLSYKIKNTFGYGFNDFLNLTRVEESIKLLLNTDKNITEISDDVGFSHVRYYNKHFKSHYKISPNEYRKKYQVSDEELERLTVYKSYPLSDGLDYLNSYLYSYERYDFDDRINKFNIDFQSESIKTLNYPDIINLGSGKDLYNFKSMDKLIDIISNLKFEYGLIENLDGIVSKDLEKEINWYYLEKLTDSILNLKLKPIFVIDGYYYIENKYTEYLRINRKDIDIENILFITEDMLYSERKELFTINDCKNDKIYMIGYVIDNNLNDDLKIPRFLDKYTNSVDKSDTFNGGKGILTYNGLKKPSYYGYEFLSLLGGDIIFKDEGLIVTKSDDGFEILLYDYSNGDKEKEKYIGLKKRFSLNILNMEEDYRIVKYEISRDSGSIYDKWIYLGKPKILNRDYMELIEKSTVPEIKFYYGKRNSVYNIVTTVKDRGAILYLFKKI